MRARTAPDFENSVLGETRDVVEVGTSAEVRTAATSMIRQARRTVDIVSRDLDAPVYDDADFLEAAKQLALRSGRTHVRVLVHDARPMVAHSHRMLALARRLSSSVDIRVQGHQHANYNCAFLIADRLGTIFRPLSDRYDGHVCFHNPREADELTELFEEMWAVADGDPNLREFKV